MIYLDHAASTPTAPEIEKKIPEILKKNFGNPSSIHQSGLYTKSLIDEARYTASEIFQTALDEIIFTSGATESLHIAIIGRVLWLTNIQKKQKITIAYSPLCHSAISQSIKFIEQNFDTRIIELELNQNGEIDLESINENLIQKTDIIVIEHANSETGLIQPIAKIGKKIQKISDNKNSQKTKNKSDKKTENTNFIKPFLIIDAAATYQTQKVSFNCLVCDAICLSGEKFGGLSGSGLLLKKNSYPIQPIFGGSQEFGLRGGTENFLGIWALGEALKLAEKNRDSLREKYKKFSEDLESFFEKEFPEIIITHKKNNFEKKSEEKSLQKNKHTKKIASIFHSILPQRKSEKIIQLCDIQGLCISAGSACSSGSTQGSSILSALGFSKEQSHCGIRISFGLATTQADIEATKKILTKVL